MKAEKRRVIIKLVIASTGLVLSAIELALTVVYQFQMIGFILAMILFVTSIIYLYQGVYAHKMQKKVEDGREPLDERRMSEATRAILEVQLKQAETKNRTAS